MATEAKENDGESEKDIHREEIEVLQIFIYQIGDLPKFSYYGILVNSLGAKGVISGLMQELFKSLPLIWTIHERTLAIPSRQYSTCGQLELLNDWKKVFNRASVVVFPDYALPMIYAAFDGGNYYVIPGSPAEAWKADANADMYKDSVRAEVAYRPDDLVIAIVGSQLLYT